MLNNKIPTFNLNLPWSMRLQAHHLSVMQGKIEQRTELYLNTVIGVAEILTQQCAKNMNRVASSASKQVHMLRSLRWH